MEKEETLHLSVISFIITDFFLFFSEREKKLETVCKPVLAQEADGQIM